MAECRNCGMAIPSVEDYCSLRCMQAIEGPTAGVIPAKRAPARLPDGNPHE